MQVSMQDNVDLLPITTIPFYLQEKKKVTSV